MVTPMGMACSLNPHPCMQGPCGPQRDSPGTYVVNGLKYQVTMHGPIRDQNFILMPLADAEECGSFETSHSFQKRLLSF